MVREYSRHVQELQVLTPDGSKLSATKIAKNHWQIDNPQQGEVQVRYRLYANDLTVRTNHLDQTHGYFNGAATFFYIPDYLNHRSDDRSAATELGDRDSIATNWGTEVFSAGF